MQQVALGSGSMDKQGQCKHRQGANAKHHGCWTAHPPRCCHAWLTIAGVPLLHILLPHPQALKVNMLLRSWRKMERKKGPTGMSR